MSKLLVHLSPIVHTFYAEAGIHFHFGSFCYVSGVRNTFLHTCFAIGLLPKHCSTQLSQSRTWDALCEEVNDVCFGWFLRN